MAGMTALRLPPDAEIVVNRLDEPLGPEWRTVLVVRKAALEIEARREAATRLYWFHAFALHPDGQRSDVVAIRAAPHIRGVVAITAGLLRRERAATLGATCSDTEAPAS